MQNLAEKPFARIRPAALGEIPRANLFRQARDLGRFSHASVVFPQPRHRSRIFGILFLERERLTVRIHRQGGAARRVHADANDAFWLSRGPSFRIGKRLLMLISAPLT
jgi:hypothetical protein